DCLPPLWPRQICQCPADVRAERDHLLGRMAPPGRLGAALLHPRHPLALPQDEPVLLHVRLGEGDGAALPLRPADAPRLEDLPALVADFRRVGLRMADADSLWR